MIAANGNSWSFSSGNQMLSVQKEQPYVFPENQGWVAHDIAVSPLTVSILGEQRAVCRTHYKGNDIFGFAYQNTCAIGINNSVAGIVNYSNSEYQVVDASLGSLNQRVTTSLKDGEVAELCYRNDGVKVGVGYSLNQRRCQSAQAQMKAMNGGNWTFSSGNKFISF